MTAAGANVGYEYFQIICAAFSCAGTALVLLTGLIFPIMVQKSQFMRLIMAISGCDLFGSLVSLAGYPSNELTCFVQGLFVTFFYRCSYLYTVALAFQLYSLVIYNKLIIRERWIHIASLLVSIVLAIIPLSGNATYGIPSNPGLGGGTCWFTSTDDSSAIPIFFFLGTIIVPVFLSVIAVIAIYVRIWWYYKHQKNMQFSSSTLSSSGNTYNPRVRMVINTLAQYPAAMLITWFPLNIAVLVVWLTPSQDLEQDIHILMIMVSVGSLYGFILAVIFFASSKEARQRWYLLIYGQHAVKVDIIVDNFSTVEVGTSCNINLIYVEIHAFFVASLLTGIRHN